MTKKRLLQIVVLIINIGVLLFLLPGTKETVKEHTQKMKTSGAGKAMDLLEKKITTKFEKKRTV